MLLFFSCIPNFIHKLVSVEKMKKKGMHQTYILIFLLDWYYINDFVTSEKKKLKFLILFFQHENPKIIFFFFLFCILHFCFFLKFTLSSDFSTAFNLFSLISYKILRATWFYTHGIKTNNYNRKLFLFCFSFVSTAY